MVTKTWAGQLELPKQAGTSNKLKLHFVFEITITHVILSDFTLFILKFLYFSFEFLDLEKQKFHKQTYLLIETLILIYCRLQSGYIPPYFVS